MWSRAQVITIIIATGIQVLHTLLPHHPPPYHPSTGPHNHRYVGHEFHSSDYISIASLTSYVCCYQLVFTWHKNLRYSVLLGCLYFSIAMVTVLLEYNYPCTLHRAFYSWDINLLYSTLYSTPSEPMIQTPSMHVSPFTVKYNIGLLLNERFTRRLCWLGHVEITLINLLVVMTTLYTDLCAGA